MAEILNKWISLFSCIKHTFGSNGELGQYYVLDGGVDGKTQASYGDSKIIVLVAK